MEQALGWSTPAALAGTTELWLSGAPPRGGAVGSGRLLAGLSDPEDGGSALGALPLGGGPAVPELDLLGLVDVSVVPAL